MKTWVPIVGYEGYYEISSDLEFRSVDRIIPHKRFGTQKITGKLISPTLGSRGYMVICLSKNGKQKVHTIHRLIAKTFLDNPFSLPEVDHIDSNPLNNALGNLQWISKEDHAIKTNSKNYVFVSPEGELMEIYNLSDFCETLGLNKSHMYQVFKGKRPQHKGWKSNGYN